MMQDPAFQAQMRKISQSAAFQQSMKKTQEFMKDPAKVKEMEDKMKKSLAEGQEQLDALQKEAAEKKKKEEAAQAVEDVPDIAGDNDSKPAATDLPPVQFN